MQITYLGHSCFVLQSAGHKLIIDPYEGGAFEGFNLRIEDYPQAIDGVEGVAVTHHHADHDYVKPFSGAKVFDGVKSIGKPPIELIPGFTLSSYRTDHGPGRGECSAISIFVEGKRFVHLGDTSSLPPETETQVKDADYLMIPVGGYFTMGPQEAAKLAKTLNPRFVVPMHYAIKGKSSLVPHTLDDFLKASSGLNVLIINLGGSKTL
ncbi:MAG: MBL fold metallo-hydrolase [Thermoprotei archaeon]|nr:MBL fold metallo-hydrolase [TACK group archaeon]